MINVDKSDTISAYVDSLNAGDHHARRTGGQGMQVRMPPPVVWAMYAISLIAMFLAGMQSGVRPEPQPDSA